MATIYPGCETEALRHALAGSIKRIDAAKLTSLVRAAAPERVLEVGSFLGFSTRILLDATETNGAAVVSVDPRVRHRVFDDPLRHVRAFNPDDRLECRTAFFGSRRIEPMVHDYVTYPPTISRRRARRLLRGIETITEPFDEFDFVFIDGDHSYQATMENVALALQMMRPGGLVVVHDALTWPAVRPAAVDVADLVPGVTVVGVTGAHRRWFFVDDEPQWLRPVRRARARLVGSPADGLCVLEMSATADIDEVRASAAAITPEVIANSRRRRSGQWTRERPAETEIGKLARRSRRLVTEPAAVLSQLRSRSAPGEPGLRTG